MPRYAIHNGTTQRRTAPESRRVSAAGRTLARRAAFLLSISLVALPLLAQHAGHGGNSQPSAPHQSAPHPSSPPALRRSPHIGRPARTCLSWTRLSRSSARLRSPAEQPVYGGAHTRREHSLSVSHRPRTLLRTPGNAGGPHLGNWLQSHQGQSFAGQENALRREPGFNSLPQQQQQRLIDRLHQLDTMPPQQRQRTLGRIENMERLTPDRRQAVRNSAQELSNMDPERKQQVRGAFRALREMPPAERSQVLNSPAYRSMYSDHERQVLGNLLSVEPYTPR